MKELEVATFGGGCFWCIEAIVQRLKGVEKITSGYAAGKTENPTYEQICSGTTGHAEVIQVEFNPEQITYEELIHIFMTSHDPTTLNRQGADRGTQYRSIILFHNKEQQQVSLDVIETLKDSFDDAIVTEVTPLTKFYPAEIYHQNYYNNNSNAGYCRVVISPKVSKLREMYADKLKDN